MSAPDDQWCRAPRIGKRRRHESTLCFKKRPCPDHDAVVTAVEYHTEAPFVVPDVVAHGDYRCPDCGWACTFPTCSMPGLVLSMRFQCGCPRTIELLPPSAVAGDS